MTAFTTRFAVRFRHCDPAGIVFYPRYFEMLNDVIEDWFDSIGWGFASMTAPDGLAFPLVIVDADFYLPSRLGDILTAELDIVTMGRTSCAASVVLTGPDEQRRVRFGPKMVCVRRDTLRPEPWPDALRAAMRAERRA